jgi:hypothetical protein
MRKVTNDDYQAADFALSLALLALIFVGVAGLDPALSRGSGWTWCRTIWCRASLA